MHRGHQQQVLMSAVFRRCGSRPRPTPRDTPPTLLHAERATDRYGVLDTASSRDSARQATLAAMNSFPPTLAQRGKNPPTCACPQPMRTECWSPHNARTRGITRSTLSIANNPCGFHGIVPPQESRCPWHFSTDITRRQVNNDRGLRVTAHRVSKLLKTLTHER